MKKITEIYKDYKIMPLLAMHQMRVAAVAGRICDSLDFKINKDDVVKACLLHDMGNIIKFNFDNFIEACEPEGKDYWQKVKEEYISLYGENEHIATEIIVKELGKSAYICELINSVSFKKLNNIILSDDFGKKICTYSDVRISPYGVVSVKERILEATERYKNTSRAFSDDDKNLFMKNVCSIEDQIFAHCKIKPEDINDESIKLDLEKLKSVQI